MSAFENFCSLITLKIAMQYLSQSNSFLPLKAMVLFFITWSCYLLQASSGIHATPSVNWFSSWSHQKTTEGKKKRFVFFSLNEMNHFNQEVWQAQTAMGKTAVTATTLSWSSEVPNWAHMKLYSQAFWSINWFSYILQSGPYDHTVHVHTYRIFFGTQSLIFSSPVYLWAA